MREGHHSGKRRRVISPRRGAYSEVPPYRRGPEVQQSRSLYEFTREELPYRRPAVERNEESQYDRFYHQPPPRSHYQARHIGTKPPPTRRRSISQGQDLDYRLGFHADRWGYMATPPRMRELATPTRMRELATPTRMRELATPTRMRELATPTRMRELVTPPRMREAPMDTGEGLSLPRSKLRLMSPATAGMREGMGYARFREPPEEAIEDDCGETYYSDSRSGQVNQESYDYESDDGPPIRYSANGEPLRYYRDRVDIQPNILYESDYRRSDVDVDSVYHLPVDRMPSYRTERYHRRATYHPPEESARQRLGSNQRERAVRPEESARQRLGSNQRERERERAVRPEESARQRLGSNQRERGVRPEESARQRLGSNQRERAVRPEESARQRLGSNQRERERERAVRHHDSRRFRVQPKPVYEYEAECVKPVSNNTSTESHPNYHYAYSDEQEEVQDVVTLSRHSAKAPISSSPRSLLLEFHGKGSEEPRPSSSPSEFISRPERPLPNSDPLPAANRSPSAHKSLPRTPSPQGESPRKRPAATENLTVSPKRRIIPSAGPQFRKSIDVEVSTSVSASALDVLLISFGRELEPKLDSALDDLHQWKRICLREDADGSKCFEANVTPLWLDPNDWSDARLKLTGFARVIEFLIRSSELNRVPQLLNRILAPGFVQSYTGLESLLIVALTLNDALLPNYRSDIWNCVIHLLGQFVEIPHGKPVSCEASLTELEKAFIRQAEGGSAQGVLVSWKAVVAMSQLTCDSGGRIHEVAELGRLKLDANATDIDGVLPLVQRVRSVITEDLKCISERPLRNKRVALIDPRWANEKKAGALRTLAHDDIARWEHYPVLRIIFEDGLQNVSPRDSGFAELSGGVNQLEEARNQLLKCLSGQNNPRSNFIWCHDKIAAPMSTTPSWNVPVRESAVWSLALSATGTAAILTICLFLIAPAHDRIAAKLRRVEEFACSMGSSPVAGDVLRSGLQLWAASGPREAAPTIEVDEYPLELPTRLSWSLIFDIAYSQQGSLADIQGVKTQISEGGSVNRFLLTILREVGRRYLEDRPDKAESGTHRNLLQGICICVRVAVLHLLGYFAVGFGTPMYTTVQVSNGNIDSFYVGTAVSTNGISSALRGLQAVTIIYSFEVLDNRSLLRELQTAALGRTRDVIVALQVRLFDEARIFPSISNGKIKELEWGVLGSCWRVAAKIFVRNRTINQHDDAPTIEEQSYWESSVGYAREDWVTWSAVWAAVSSWGWHVHEVLQADPICRRTSLSVVDLTALMPPGVDLPFDIYAPEPSFMIPRLLSAFNLRLILQQMSAKRVRRVFGAYLPDSRVMGPAGSFAGQLELLDPRFMEDDVEPTEDREQNPPPLIAVYKALAERMASIGATTVSTSAPRWLHDMLPTYFATLALSIIPIEPRIQSHGVPTMPFGPFLSYSLRVGHRAAPPDSVLAFLKPYTDSHGLAQSAAELTPGRSIGVTSAFPLSHHPVVVGEGQLQQREKQQLSDWMVRCIADAVISNLKAGTPVRGAAVSTTRVLDQVWLLLGNVLGSAVQADPGIAATLTAKMSQLVTATPALTLAVLSKGLDDSGPLRPSATELLVHALLQAAMELLEQQRGWSVHGLPVQGSLDGQGSICMFAVLAINLALQRLARNTQQLPFTEMMAKIFHTVRFHSDYWLSRKVHLDRQRSWQPGESPRQPLSDAAGQYMRGSILTTQELIENMEETTASTEDVEVKRLKDLVSRKATGDCHSKDEESETDESLGWIDFDFGGEEAEGHIDWKRTTDKLHRRGILDELEVDGNDRRQTSKLRREFYKNLERTPEWQQFYNQWFTVHGGGASGKNIDAVADKFVKDDIVEPK